MTPSRELADLLRVSSLSAPDLLPADVAIILQTAGCTRVALYLADYELVGLHPLEIGAALHTDGDARSIAGSVAGRCFQRQQVISAEQDGGGWRVYAPVRERAERIGVLEIDVPAVDDATLLLFEDCGRLVGHLVHTAARYTDAIEVRRRQQNMSLTAEIQWDLLVPPLTFITREVAVAGLVEPAYEVAGDGFDYALNGDLLDIAVLDAMGHGLGSSLASALALSAARHGRRAGNDIVEIALSIDAALTSQFHGEMFVTGHIARLDVATGRLRWVNAGHPEPLLIRGTRVVGELHAEPSLPFGLGIRVSDVGECVLQPGDRVFFFSDGATEAHAPGGEQYGNDRLVDQLEQHLGAGISLDEVLRRVVADVRCHRAAELEDDVTLVAVSWMAPLAD
ncbi:MAG: PP2C family protein-serine/threonine phosphatase [Acidimicrobiales bacterium]